MTGSKEACFSRGKDDWETPPEVFEPLNKVFHFTLDVASSHENAKCELYFTETGLHKTHQFGTRTFNSDDGLSGDWEGHTCWMNPPYSNWQKWVAKASVEAAKGATVVALLPARTDTKAFHEYIWKKPSVEIRFVKGRIKFVGAEQGAPFPSMVVIFHGQT